MKFILHANSHHQYEFVEVMYTNPAIPILICRFSTKKEISIDCAWVPYIRAYTYLEVLKVQSVARSRGN